MFDTKTIQDGDPLPAVVSDLPPNAETSEYDPEFEAFLETLLAGDDTQTEMDVAAVLAREVAHDDFADYLGTEAPMAAGRQAERSAPDETPATEATPAESSAIKALIADFDDESLLTELQSAHRAISAAQARQALLITELALRRAKDAVTELTGRKARGQQALGLAARALSEEVSLELCLSKITAGTLVDTCVGLCTECPDTLDALAAGDIDWEKATAIVGLVQSLVHAQECTNPDLEPENQVDPDALGKALEEELLKKAGTEPVAGIRRAAARMMIEVNTRAAEHRHAIKKSHRQFWYTGEEDSMCRIGGYLPADAGMRVKHALTRLAYHARNLGHPGDKRTLDQLRIDSLVETLTAAADNLHGQDVPEPAATSTTGHADRDESAGDDPAADADQNPNPSTSNNTEATTPHDAPEGLVHDEDADVDKDDEDDELDPHDDPDPSAGSKSASELGQGLRTGRMPRAGQKLKAGRKLKVSSGPGRGRSGSDPRVTITIAAGTLIGLDEHPGFLHGYGPVVASMARDVAATGTWRCAITDDVHGTLMGLGTSTYTSKYKPTRALRHFLMTRDRVCRVPGCSAPAMVCDVDHRIPWPDGPTCECCTECLCGTHHRLKHEAGFTLTPSTDPNDPPGTLYWGTPARHQYPSYTAQLDPHPPGSPTPGGEPKQAGPPEPKSGEARSGEREPGKPKPDEPERGKPRPDEPRTGQPRTGQPRPGESRPEEPETSGDQTCSACTNADAEISAEAAAIRALEEEQARARADAARRGRTAATAHSRRYTDPDDYDDNLYRSTDEEDPGDPDTSGPYIPNPFYHRETLYGITSNRQSRAPAADAASPADAPAPPARTGRPRLGSRLNVRDLPPLNFDGPPPF